MGFNVLIIVSMLIAFVLTLLLGVVYIDFLKKKMYTQYILSDAPENHAKKAGTPTTGGVFIVVSIIFASLVALTMNQSLTTASVLILITFLFFMLAGLTDDLGKIKGKENKAGLTPKKKLFFQIAIALLPAIYMTFENQTYLSIGHYSFDLQYFYPLFVIFFMTGVSNAVNLTDGLDGLAASVGIPAFLACGVISFLSGHTVVAIVCAAAIGASLGFLRYNKPKAQVFMGDTGSLAMGGLLGTLAILGRCELLLAVFAGVIVMETLSVILQVTSYRFTGKRIFKMAPIHHHFELCGWSETRVVAVFSIVTAILCLIALIAL